jgi:murein DD-endopeptidase MepM/ murein hydrolase activator NlpD
MAAAEDAAQAAKQQADAQLAAQQNAYEQVAAQKAAYEQQLQAAQIHLLELQGARNAYDQWVAQKAAEEAAARAAAEKAARDAAAAAAAARNNSGGGGGGGGGSGGGGDYVQPAYGRVSSCFGARWGVTHFGVDIAAPIGTPIYAATSGVVKRAGAATGFGLAVYILGTDGAVTVYGHVNRYFVEVGDRVSAGEQIAEVGNRGQSTGPHLHFEVHTGGQLYSNQINPVPWLNNRGVYLGGCGG